MHGAASGPSDAVCHAARRSLHSMHGAGQSLRLLARALVRLMSELSAFILSL